MLTLPLDINPHIDPLRKPLPAQSRRCPLDFRGMDRTNVGHDGFDYNPYRWLEKDMDEELLFRMEYSNESSGQAQASSGAATAVLVAPKVEEAEA